MSFEKTYIPKAGDITQEWVLVDADGQNLGRLATQISSIMLGKHKPTFTPGVDTGDFVVVVNCERITVTVFKKTARTNDNGRLTKILDQVLKLFRDLLGKFSAEQLFP